MGLLDALSADDQRSVRQLLRRRKYAKGEVVCHAGEPGDTLHIIDRGRVAIRLPSPDGSFVTAALYGPGDFFGELALLDAAARRTATVSALEATETLTLFRDDFTRLRHEHAAVTDLVLVALQQQVLRLSTSLVEALYMAADDRLLARLAELAALYADGDAPVVVPLTQDEVAGVAGTTRTTANRVLRRLEHDGVITLTRGRITINDTAALNRSAPRG